MPYFVLISERSSGWNWSLPMRRQAEWEAHAVFMDALESEGFIRARSRRDPNSHGEGSVDADALVDYRQHRTWSVLLGGFRL